MRQHRRNRDAEWRAHWKEAEAAIPALALPDDFQPPEPPVGSPDQWDAVDKTLGFREVDPLRRMLLSAHLSEAFCSCFRLLTDDEVGNPLPGEVKPSTVRRALTEMDKRIKDLALALIAPSKLSTPRNGFGELHGYVLGEIVNSWPVDIRKALLENLVLLAGRNRRLRDQIPREDGYRCGRHGLLIFSLASIYQGFSGQRAAVSYDPTKRSYGGPFLRFIDVCWNIYRPNEPRSCLGSGKTIKRRLTKSPAPDLWTLLPQIQALHVSISEAHRVSPI